ncbi:MULTISPECIES: ATP-binding cassette domain-containing protein [unclassified Leifsonia]|uniref:ATP-binding cassette domain-containing protein n=1 Tax=unclassified Leifsonia TaxID=2663824 RepID=UPI0008A7BAF2|nr:MULTISPECIES: ATP-binding cassette domain-containing protein [unclassified Leifsonia]SEH69340.1 ABC transporter [Leifsonia sp. CL154]SFL30636.1 ABC transporter [Leifsonia sp. CL147]
MSYRFGSGNVLFENLDLDFRPGEMVALTGPSGAGKSTLLSLIAGWRLPTTGQIERDGIATVSWVFQNPLGVARRSALDHVILPLLANGHSLAAARRRAAEILVMFELGEVADSPYRHLSGGQAQRLMLARAIAVRPDLLLVDEPTAQLDLLAASSVNRVLRNVADDRCIVVVASHDAHTVAACSRTLDLGRFAPGQFEAIRSNVPAVVIA